MPSFRTPVVASRRHNPLTAVCGAYDSFEVYALALLALGENDNEACRLLSDTLGMIDRNFEDERPDPAKKWHLADFAMHPLLSAYFLCRTTRFPDDGVWERIAAAAQQFLFHAVLADGRTGRDHRAEARTGQPSYWNYANVPPGHDGDVRPGYWQGSGSGPRSFGAGALAFLIYEIPEDDPLPWARLYLPRRTFDEGRDRAPWAFPRRGNGYAALWLTGGYSETTDGFWAGNELRMEGNRSALLSFVGDLESERDFETPASSYDLDLSGVFG